MKTESILVGTPEELHEHFDKIVEIKDYPSEFFDTNLFSGSGIKKQINDIVENHGGIGQVYHKVSVTRVPEKEGMTKEVNISTIGTYIHVQNPITETELIKLIKSIK